MAARMAGHAQSGLTVVGVFYGHPGVFTDPSHRAVAIAPRAGIPAQMLPGVSALDCLCADLGIDIGEGSSQTFDATEMMMRARRPTPGARDHLADRRARPARLRSSPGRLTRPDTAGGLPAPVLPAGASGHALSGGPTGALRPGGGGAGAEGLGGYRGCRHLDAVRAAGVGPGVRHGDGGDPRPRRSGQVRRGAGRTPPLTGMVRSQRCRSGTGTSPWPRLARCPVCWKV